MVRKNYWNTGDSVPSAGTYTSFCDNALEQLNAGSTFPPCPTCHLAASWRLNPSTSVTATAKPALKKARKKA